MLEIKDLPASLPISAWKGNDIDWTIEVVTVDEDDVESTIDFSGWEGVMVFERPGTDTAILTIGTATGEMTFPAESEIRIQIDADDLYDALSLGKYDYRIKLTTPGGFRKDYFAGPFKLQFK